ncbi:hypothetical protein EIP91_012383 [Steccherinum ochraceum]|uniref:Uncharacterized protein n=1 Tax=Steccherinum ochraceum TaxID=92696 RepID=A0A4R0RGM0_9APHY|nr:hypothetical protein EIP91_012383 [Steccherinum ochraceum]
MAEKPKQHPSSITGIVHRYLLMLSLTRPLFFTLLVLTKPTQISRISSLSSMSSNSSQVDPAFLQNALSSILSAPHISFPRPPAGLPNIRMGHGPIDLFSTRFVNTFTDDATGVVAGQEVDKEGLKAALLSLQKKWQSDSVKFDEQEATVSDAAAGERKLTTAFTWTPRQESGTASVKASATVKEVGGAPRIHTLSLDGDAALFSS